MTGTIENLEDIRRLVDTFYARVREDDLIGPVFNTRIGNRWLEHLDKMYRFWQTILLNERTYDGAPFPPHIGLPIDKEHFDRWIGLFTQTIDELFEGELAGEAKLRAEKMAEMFRHKLDYYRNKPATPLL